VIKFSHNDCKRSIPSLFDGLKESQRKILYCVKKRNLTFNKPSLKVAQLGGYVAEHSNYHHGEQNLYDTVVKMAHDFIGSNNIPLLYRDGMFGTRISLGKDAASARYIFTKMETLTPLLFREEDDVLLTHVIDDGDVVEPEFYIPILPTILINGCVGIGSGWSSSIPCFNPLDILESVRTWLDHDGEVLLIDPDDNSELSLLPEIKPWYRDFEGTIEKDNDKYITYGNIVKNSDKVKVTELPVGMSTDKFKENCEDWLVNKNIKSMKNYSTPKKVDFLITESDDGLSCTLENMKLYSYLHTSNMVLFNEKQQLKKYTIDQIINDFCKMRYEFYVKRKKYIINNLEKELRFIGNKARFIQEVVDKKLNIMNIDEELVIKELEKRGYDKESRKENDEGGYNYLLTMQVRTFTANKIKQLKNDLESSKKKLEYAKTTTEKQMWLNELKEFETEYQKWLKNMKQLSTSTETKKKK
jgi:DNA topoisomerase-2